MPGLAVLRINIMYCSQPSLLAAVANDDSVYQIGAAASDHNPGDGPLW